jgi:hypothetical protein
VAECLEVGTVSQGTAVEEALANLKEATELYLEEFPLEEGGHPLLTTFEAKVAYPAAGFRRRSNSSFGTPWVYPGTAAW